MAAVAPESVLAAQATASHLGLLFSTSVILLHGCMSGVSLGYSGLVLPHHLAANSTLLTLSQEQATWFNSVTPLGMCLGVLLSIPASEMLGRRKLFLLSNLVSLLGFLALYFSPSFLVLFLARSFGCTGLGLGAMTSGVYLSEIGIVALRGPIIGSSQTSFSVGLLCYTALCNILPIELLSLAVAGHCLLVLLLLLLLPESPQWLMRHGKEQEARESLLFLRGGQYPGIEVELGEIKQCIKERESLKQASFAQAIGSRTFSRPMATFSIIFILLGICGNDSLVYYGPTIFFQLDTGLSPGLMATLPWIGFSVGYALSSPLMARLEIIKGNCNQQNNSG